MVGRERPAILFDEVRLDEVRRFGSYTFSHGEEVLTMVTIGILRRSASR